MSVAPSQKACASILEQLELNGPTYLLPHYDCPRSDLTAADHIANLHLNQIAALKLTVDCQVEQRAISQAPPLIETESDFAQLLRFQSALRADRSFRIPDWTSVEVVVGFGHLHDRSPVARLAARRMVGSQKDTPSGTADQHTSFRSGREKVG